MITLQEVGFTYGKKRVFDQLSITFETGSIYGLLGKNGTGKSTLFRLICGLLKPTKGSVLTFGQVAVKRRPDMLSKVFLLPEEFHVPPVLVSELARYLGPFYPNYDHDLFLRLLEDFQLPVSNHLTQMSLGQKKKSLIAFSLATNTELLLMDEPTNGLDILSKVQFKKVIQSVSRPDKCIVISTHQVKDIEDLVNRISVIDEGKVLFDQALHNISKKVERVYSSTPIPTAIYQEATPQGYISLVPTQQEHSSGVDLELLYKAIMTDPVRLTQQFSL
ncbi:MAG: ABC transporter ATP-binding protein [Cytophagaceae bacterium]|jgi:ABC-2 type transport system ATP-binding protein|nr:ABC transporter ATP-binding protein [Cytophagaceae bacterium]